MNLPVIVLQSGWRPSTIAARSARTASRVIFDLPLDLRMGASAFGPDRNQGLVPQLVTHCFGAADCSGGEFRIKGRIGGLDFIGRESRINIGQLDSAKREYTRRWGNGHRRKPPCCCPAGSDSTGPVGAPPNRLDVVPVT